ncbi:MAG: MOSC domain-containing protein [Pseudomonadales bacterium]|nr:MOSC domain-containing protein [Pseudomonadales bacterium]NIX09288.1 MOSC domain-containing protein [Pseudomonadales bacterium]
MAGTVEGIYLAAKHGDPQHAVPEARLTVGVGLEGDRHANANGGVVSLIEAEALERFVAETGLPITAPDTGRNIATRGIGLNELVGRQFRVGGVLMEAFELCEPCATLGARLASPEVSAAAIVGAFAHSGGIRAFVRGSGTIAPGSAVEPA